ncbi:hypothetical protein RDI58_027831 [Solanum bulbocastanum]|uniref:Uncharacterized protein n=1 Tax=Solanum bulbocastanum TaxID=147425 RepID=A0AAN8Y249_SOLBU
MGAKQFDKQKHQAIFFD